MDDATKRWIRTKQDRKAAEAGYRFDENSGLVAVEFIETICRHSKGRWAGELFSLLDWEREFVMRLFGWKRPDGQRRFRKCGIWVAKKNGKSTLAAAIILYLLTACGEEGAEIYTAAADHRQAAIIFKEAAAMVAKSPELSRRLKVTETTKTITRDISSWYRALSSEHKAQEGLNAFAVVVDEMHVVDRALYEALVHSGAARLEPLQLTISTAGFDQDTIGWEQYEYARSVLNDTIEDWAFLPIICEADESLAIDDPKAWAQANPSLGNIVMADELAAAAAEAKASPAKENSFRRYRLNQWTAQETRWLSTERWNACGGEVGIDSLIGKRCCGGLDLAKTKDLTALVLAFPDDEDDEDTSYTLLPWFFLPGKTILDAEHRDGVPYSHWARHGHVITTDSWATDYKFVKEKILELANKFDLQEIEYDPWNAQQFADDLSDEGLTMLARRQGDVSMNEPCLQFERLMLEGKLRHGNHPVLDWNAGNVCVHIGATGLIKPDKAASKKKIDGIVAAIMAVARARAMKPGGSVYDTRGVLVL